MAYDGGQAESLHWPLKYSRTTGSKGQFLVGKMGLIVFQGNTAQREVQILFYKNTKYDLDILDGMTRNTSKGGIRRWPVVVFCNILDLSGLYVHIRGQLTTCLTVRSFSHL
ncbi:hypothetical protein ILYODFUR_016710 [Ilyodon furcidens]|uniref:Uncharacterized protein n=1 Tax=Ilyodon furcidens TaxID=33524 RepID=A0ABV0V4C6_9TELE